MQDPHAPDPSLPDWHWHVFVQIGAPGNEFYRQQDGGNWNAATPEDLARDLASQMMGPEWPYWVIVIFPEDCVGHESVLRYTRDDHEAWLANLSVGGVLEAHSDATEGKHHARTNGAAELPPEAAPGRVPLRPIGWPDADQPDPGLPVSQDLADALRHFENLLDHDGDFSRDKLVREVGAVVSALVLTAVHEARQQGPEAVWTDDPKAVKAFAAVAATFVAAYLGDGS